MPLIGSKRRHSAGATTTRHLVAAGAFSFPLLLSGCDAAATAPTEYAAASASASLSLSLPSVDLYPGDTLRIAAPETGASWITSDSTIAIVNTSGLITAKHPGQVEVRAETRRGHGSTKVKVREKKSGIYVSPKTAVLESAPAALQLTAYRFPNGSADGAVWESLHPEVATVDGMGRVISKTAGVALITVTLGGAADTATVHVAPIPGPAEPPPSSPAPPPGSGAAPELPQVYLGSSMPTGIRDTIRVSPGGSLQSALNSAASKESAVVLLSPGSYPGRLTLPARSGAGWVVIASDAPLPAEGTRVTPATASGFATIVAGSEWGIQAVSGAKRYRLTGLEITTDRAVTGGRPQIEMETGSEFITVDRSYVHGHPSQSFQRCIMANGNSVAVIDSYVSECHMIGFDSQAIGSWQSDGPVKIVNNFLEGAGENVLFGGSGSGDPGERVTSDIEIRGNHFFKPLTWLGGPWSVKNLFELKNAQRVLVEGNVFENNWTAAVNGGAGGQPGFAIQWTVRNQSGQDTQATVSDITFRWNIVRHSAAGINILAHDSGGKESDWAKRIEISDNSFESIGQDPALGSSGRAIQVLKNAADLRILRNTFDAAHSMMIFDAAGAPLVRLRVEDNLIGATQYGLFGNGTGEALKTWATHTAGDYVFRGNAVVGRVANRYPDAGGNAFPSSLATYAGGAGVGKTRLAEMTRNVAGR